MWKEILGAITGELWTPLILQHENLNIPWIKKSTTLQDLSYQRDVFIKIIEWYFDWIWVFWEGWRDNEESINIKKRAKDLCFMYYSKEDIEKDRSKLMKLCWKQAVDLAIKHYNLSWAREAAMLERASQLESDEEAAELERKLGTFN